MATNKRKTLMIKRPSPNESDKPRPKPQVKESPAGSVETEKLKPTSAGNPSPVRTVGDDKGATARISLPDEAKIRKARRADESDEKLPGAPEVMDAASNATRQIEIDTEEVTHAGSAPKFNDSEDLGNNDQTMQINADALETGELKPVSKINVDDLSEKTQQATRVDTGKVQPIDDSELQKPSPSKQELEAADAELNAGNDQTMAIDADAFRTGKIEKQLDEADQDLRGNNDQTMAIDAEAFRTAQIEKEKLEEDDSWNDRTMQINAESLNTAPIEDQLEEADEELSTGGDQTMEIDAEAFRTGKIEKQDLEEAGRMDLMSQETMQMESIEDELNAATAELEPPAEGKSGGETAKINDSYNAATMAMDPNELARELAKEKTQPSPVSDEERNQTMDLSDVKPKTILIKRPSQSEAPSAPTVKTVRPDAQTVRTSRPAGGEAAASGGASDGKTVKLRRPAGAGPRPGAPVSRVAANAGLEIGEDGNVAVKAKAKGTSLGPAWLALSILTLVIMCGALWIALAMNMPELPMPGRLVNELDQILPLS
jgi:hypothetical protein